MEESTVGGSGLKHSLFYAVHEGFAEFFGDGDLFAADEDLVVADGFEAGDVDDIGVVDAGERGGELFFDVFEAAVDEEFVNGGDDANIFFFAFEVEDVFEEDFLEGAAGFDEKVFVFGG